MGIPASPVSRPVSRKSWSNGPSVSKTHQPQVADSDSAEGSDASGHFGIPPSIRGDTLGEDSAADASAGEEAAVADRRERRAQPKEPRQGVPNPATRNKGPEVVNFGLFCGNWGMRASIAKGVALKRRKRHDRQV